jgi:hypothetical protein
LGDLTEGVSFGQLLFFNESDFISIADAQRDNHQSASSRAEPLSSERKELADQFEVSTPVRVCSIT